ncbi:MAG TPA: pyridoxamine 5'-phosphate oxidase family protein [Candidatus Binatia bacterium]|nr:pyridoxamine 5'-phosphate oxidase family protein [Candidatus Binatia bacterium]
MTHWQKKLESLKQRSTCRITTRGRRTGRPHAVTIWFAVGDDGRIYLATLKMRRDWPKNVAANPDVLLEIADLRLNGRAEQVREQSERTRIESLMAAKYWAAWIGSWLGFKPQGVFEVRVNGEA